MERMMFSREPPWLLGLLLIGRANFVARIICSRRPLSQRPIYSSVRPIVSGVEPRGYALAVSKKKTPLSKALSIIAREVGSSHLFPKVIGPRQISETCSPVRPRYVTFILSPPSMYDAEGDGKRCFKLSNNLWSHARSSQIRCKSEGFLHDQAWYCSSLTFSIQSAVLPSRRS